MIKRIKNWIKGKKESPEFYNVHHPNFMNQVEPAFQIKGVQYYRFKQETKIPYGRYQVLQSFLLSYDLRMDYTLFKAYLEQIESVLNGAKGSINLAKAFELIEKMKARAALAFDPAQAYNIASVVYFDQNEDLYKYDSIHNQNKIAAWKEAGQLDFFYTRPISELLGLSNFSESALTEYIKEASDLIRDLSFDTQTA